MGFWDVLKGIGGFAPIIGPAISGIGGLLSNTQGARTGTTNSTFNNTYSNTPTETPEFAGFGGMLKDIISKRLSQPVPMEGYAATGLGNINRNSDLVQQSIKNKLTASGLAGSPIAGNAMLQGELSRGGQATDFMNQLPLVQRQLQNQDFSQALGLYGARPLGSTTTASGTSSGTQVHPGSALGAGFSEAGDLLSFLAGQGLLGGKKATNPIGDYGGF